MKTVLRSTALLAVFFTLSAGLWASDFITGYSWVTGQGPAQNATNGQLATAGCSVNTGLACTTADADVTFTTSGLNNDTLVDTYQNWFNANAAGGFPVHNVAFQNGTTGNTSIDGTLWEFVGQAVYTNGQSISVTHDDGFSYYIDGVQVFSNPGGTTSKTDTFTFTGSSGVHNFELVYGECCVQPAVLQTTLVQPIPEPRDMAWVLFGVLGCAVLLRRKFASQQ